jgi:hypothetical protein
MKEKETSTVNKKKRQTRRDFLKKSAYAAPTLLLLGALAKPSKLYADSGEPSGPPSWGGF